MAARTRKRPSRRTSRVRVLFVTGFGPIVRDPKASRRLYIDTLGIKFGETDGYFHTEKLEGAKAFALWPLAQAAESCFGTRHWPTDLPVPQGWLEFDVDDVGAATASLRKRGYRVLVDNRTEPWGQTVTRLLSPEGLLVGITYTPWMRKD
jgi:catechol 2,3-dioxygenase-like lactoylglutathione lyase family enzyme